MTRRWNPERLVERVCVRIAAHDRLRLNDAAAERGLSEPEAIRLAVTAWLATIGGNGGTDEA
jgi:hypothetical protein